MTRKKAEKAFRVSEDIYRSTFDAVPDAITIARIEDGRCMEVNEYFSRITGYSRQEVLGKTPFDLNIYVDPEDRDCFVQILKEKGEVNSFELRWRRKDGKILNILLSARPLQYGREECLIAISTDITKRKIAEEVLRESEEKYRVLIDNANDAIFIAQDEVIKFPNLRTVQLLGMSAEELSITPFVDLVHPNDKAIVIKRYKKRLEGVALPQTYTYRFLHRNRGEVWVDLNTVLITWEDRPAILCFMRDITEQKRLEAQLLYAQKMESIGTLAGGVAHNFNNLLMGIQGNISLMLTETNSTDPHHVRLKSVEKLVQSASKLTGQLLGYARGGAYEVKPISLNQLVEETSETFGITKKETTIHKELDKELSTIKADQGQIEQVLLNLYVNASDAMPLGGDLFLRTMNATHKEMKGRPYKAKTGSYVLLIVTDTGTGMDKKTMEQIFDPFFTTKGLANGTGLGLASVYGIIKAHGGYIDVFSEKGHGSTFKIYLPASKEKEANENKLPGKIVKGTETILFVDDEPMVIDVGELMLKKLGYKVLLARGGQEAIKMYKKNKDKIDLIILDMVMPDIGGGETYDSIKEINPNIKAILSSGYSVDGQAREILARGCNGFIQKPFDLKALSYKIREILDEVD